MRHFIHGFRLCVLFVTIISLSAGCSSAVPSIPEATQPTTSVEETISEATKQKMTEMAMQMISNLPKADHCAQPDELLAETDRYQFRRINGKCYLNLADGNKRIELYDGGCIIPASCLRFSSIDELCETLINGKFSDASLQVIQAYFPLDEEKGFLIADPKQLYTLKLSEDYEVSSINMNGEQLEYHVRSTSIIDGSRRFGGTVMVCSENDFLTDLTHFNRFRAGALEFKSSFEIPAINATAYNCDVPAGVFRFVQYCIQTDSKTLYIEESYAIERNDSKSTVSDTDPLEVKVYGYEDGVYYRLYTTSLDTRPSAQWLDSFHFEKYIP